MYALLKLCENIQKLESGRVFFLTFSDPQLKTLVLKLNKDQLRVGLLADGRELPMYSPTSIDKFGKKPGRYTLYDTGDFYDSFKIQTVTEDFILEFADTEKPDKDLLEYGAVLGLDEQSKDILFKEALPDIREIVLKEMLKGI